MTGPKKERDENFSPPLPEDHPLYTSGFVVGQTFSGASPSDAQKKPDVMPGFADRSPMTEEQIQAELARLKEKGYGPMELSVFEEGLRNLEGKPQGSA